MNETSEDTMFDIDSLEPNILSDDSDKIWTAISNSNNSGIIDIVCDNSGYEVLTDFCIADYLISKNLTTTIRFHLKSIPWFISDVMKRDFHWVLGQLRTSTDDGLVQLGERWTNYVDKKIWTIVENDFWTLPVDFSYMSSVNPALYKQLAEADLAIFKGDLNYRKLFGERNWDPTTPVDVALQNFNPTKLCTLRTVKADIVCGLAPGLAEKMDEISDKWMETGDYGLIQFSDKIVQI